MLQLKQLTIQAVHTMPALGFVLDTAERLPGCQLRLGSVVLNADISDTDKLTAVLRLLTHDRISVSTKLSLTLSGHMVVSTGSFHSLLLCKLLQALEAHAAPHKLLDLD